MQFTHATHITRSIGRAGGCLLALALAHSLSCTPAAMAQEAAPRITHISVEDGLSQSFVYSVYQDSRGMIWLGTRDGLNKFDGYTFTVYKHQPFQSSSISSSVVRDVAEDRAGYLWVATFRGGVNRFDRKRGEFISFQHDPADAASLCDNNVTAVLVDRRGTLWAGTQEAGLDRLDDVETIGRKAGRPPRFRHYRHMIPGPLSLESDRILTLLEDRRGRIWAGTGAGLARYDRTRDVFVPVTGLYPSATPPDVNLDRITGLEQDSRGTVWASCRRGVVGIDPATGRAFVHLAIPATRLVIDSHDRVIVSTERGLLMYDPAGGSRELISGRANGPRLASDNVLDMFRDRAGAIWIGTDNGIDRIASAPPRFALYNTATGALNGNNVRSVHDAGEGKVWLGTQGKGLTLYDRRSGSSRRYLFGGKPGTASNVINVIERDRSGGLWLGTRAGLRRFDPVAWRPIRFPGEEISFDGWNIWSICEDRAGTFWVGAIGGLFRLDRASGRLARVSLHRPSGLGTTYESVWTIREDRHGDLWMGTPGGVIRRRAATGELVWYRHDPADPRSLSHSEAFVIFEDRRGRIWIGTWGGGLNRFDSGTGTFIHYTVRDGLASNVIHGILEDAAGSLWLSTGAGISRMSPESGTFVNFDRSDGLQGVEFNPNSCAAMADGEMFFGGLNGANSFRPTRVAVDSRQAPIAVTSFKKFDALAAGELFDGESVELAPGENYCSFEFAALVYTNAERVQYAYRLEGFDQEWNYSGRRRYAAYTNLDPGEYVFRVKATNGDGVWNDRGIAIRLTVIPPFWDTWAFRGLVLVAAVGAGFAGFRMREQKRRKLELALEEARENERREIAAELHDGPLQDLYSTRFMIEPLSRSASDPSTRTAITTIDDTLRRVRGSLRNVCGDLQLPYLDSGLDAAIEAHVEQYRRELPRAEIVLDLMRDDGALSDLVRQNSFRIYRTAMNNIVKHAEASRVVIRLSWDRRQLVLEVTDNGQGFTPPASLTGLMKKKHYGLLLADAHARAMGGRLEVISVRGAGTTLRVKLER